MGVNVVIRLNSQQEHVLEHVLARGSLGARSLGELVARALADYVERHPEALEPERVRSDDASRH